MQGLDINLYLEIFPSKKMFLILSEFSRITLVCIFLMALVNLIFLYILPIKVFIEYLVITLKFIYFVQVTLVPYCVYSTTRRWWSVGLVIVQYVYGMWSQERWLIHSFITVKQFFISGNQSSNPKKTSICITRKEGC